MITDERIKRDFHYHAPDEVSIPKHEAYRAKLIEFAEFCKEALPDGREKARVFTALEDVGSCGHSAIARGRYDEKLRADANR